MTVGVFGFKLLLAVSVLLGVHRWRLHDLKIHLKRAGSGELDIVQTLLVRIHITLAIIAIVLMIR